MEGFPILLWEDLTSCVEVNDFFRFYLFRGAIESKRTWGVVAGALYDFFGYLEANDLLWTGVNRGNEENIVAAYSRYSAQVHGHKRNTVRLRLTYICEFYEYAVSRGWVPKLPYRMERRNVASTGSFFAHLDASGGTIDVRSVMPRKHRSLIKFLSAAQQRLLIEAAENPHHKMIIRLALGSGLRREELATFPTCYVTKPSTKDQSASVPVRLDPQDGSGMKTKSSKARTILISRRLMMDLHQYAELYRGERAANSVSGNSAPALFLTERGEPWADSGKGIEKMVRNVGARVGLRTHPHMLRHSYATSLLARLQRAKGRIKVEPLIFLQKQLGHESIQTTMLYLHIINELADDAVLAYDAELDAEFENWPDLTS
jgi:integrase